MSWADVGNWAKTYSQNLAGELTGNGTHKAFTRKSKPGDPSTSAVTGKSTSDSSDYLGEFHKGGRIRKTGLALVHKGERVLTKAQARKRGRK